MLLCDVFEKFIIVCLGDYNLGPSHYFSSHGLSWDAALKYTGVKLEKIQKIDVHLFLEKGMTGGVSYISKRYGKSDENADIMCWDMNNLHGTVMIFGCLPHSSFEFLSKEEIDGFNLDSIAENSRIGYILEVDLKYPNELHDLHNCYPLAPEKIDVTYDMMSKFCKDIADWHEIKVGGVKKLIRNLGDKIEHVVHYKNLKYCLSLGMELVKIYRILSFKQSNWVKSYADFNTKKRKQSNDEFNKNLYKLLNNCTYGKSIENIRKRMNLKLINDKKVYLKCINKPNFMSQKIIHKHFVAVHFSKKVLTQNKPICVGFTILELSKLKMYQFHYDYVLKTFNDVKLLFTDTDSLVYEIKGGNIHEQCFRDKHLFDFSGYPKDSVYYYDINKKC